MKKNLTRNPVPQLETSVTRTSIIDIKDSHFGNNSEVYSPAGRGMSVYDPSMMPGRFDRSGSLLYESNNNARLRGGSVLGADYAGDLDMSMGPISPRHKQDTEKKLANFDYVFVEKDSWIDDKNCYVCQRSFKRVECHHCRSCGHGMCGDCGEGTINARRVCDICFKREKIKYTQLARNIRLQKLEEQVLYKKTELKRLQQDFDLAKKNNQKQISEGHSTDSNNQTYKERLEKNKERETKMFDRAQTTNSTLKTDIEAATDLTKQKESKLTDIKMQTAALKLQLNQKLAIQKNKEKAVESLKYEKSLHYSNDSVSAVSDINGSYIVNPRNFAIAERDGVYNLSSQPYKI